MDHGWVEWHPQRKFQNNKVKSGSNEGANVRVPQSCDGWRGIKRERP